MSKAKRRGHGQGCVYRHKGRRIWWIKYRNVNGRVQQESSHSADKATAEKELRKRLVATDRGELVTADHDRLTFADAVTILVNHHKMHHRETKKLEGRIAKHLTAFFGPTRRMTTINGSLITAYVVKRQADVRTIPARRGRPARTTPTADATINRELAWLKQMFTLAIAQDRLARRPTITMLKEANARQGFFEPDQVAAVLRHLPADLRPAVAFAYHTGWRVKSEVLTRQWRHVHFADGTIKLDKGEAKNKEPRTFHLTTAVRAILERQAAERDRLKKAGHVVPWVFFRLVAQGRRGSKVPRPIKSLGKAFARACRLAGCPGRIPHDLRRTAVRRFVRLGIPEGVAMKLTGHKTRAVFERYNITSDDDLRAAAARLDDAPDAVGQHVGQHAPVATTGDDAKLLKRNGGAARN